MKDSLPPVAGPVTPAGLPERGRAVLSHAAGLWPGAGIAALVAVAATFVSTLHGGPQLLYALFFGVAFHYLSHEPTTKPGIEFCSRTLLRFGVGLLGARITASQIASLGWATALIVVGGVLSTLALGLLLARRFGLTRAQGVLSGGAVAICGASAALAISAVLPREKGGERFTLMVVVTVTVMSTLAMVLYPLAAKLLQLPPELAGLFLGGTIHDVAQVIGAGYMLNPQTGDIATIVKLFRVSMLALVVVAVAGAFKRSREEADAAHADGHTAAKQALVPWFLWLFVAMVVFNSAGIFPPSLQEQLGTVSRTCLVMAIAALGMKTSFTQLARAGWRPFVLILVETLWLALLVLGCALLLR
jgi:uncharacterized integral membrane protein (TIGR00698 family)